MSSELENAVPPAAEPAQAPQAAPPAAEEGFGSLAPMDVVPPAAGPAPTAVMASALAAAGDVAALVAHKGGEMLSSAYQAAMASEVSKKAFEVISSVPTVAYNVAETYGPVVVTGVQEAATAVISGASTAAASGFAYASSLYNSGAPSNVVLICGNNEGGALGLGPSKLFANKLTLTQIPGFPPVPERHIAQASCGNKFTIVALDNGETFYWGDNMAGLLFPSPQIVPTPLPIKVSKVFAGTNRVACLSPTGDLFVWGFNGNSELGLGDTTNRNSPVELTHFRDSGLKVVDVCFGGYHSVAVTADRQLFLWGRNDYGQLGLGDHEPRQRPTSLTASNLGVVSTVSCGSSFTAVINDNGHVFVWGSNSNGQLGLTSSEKATPQPAFVEALGESKAISVSCGFSHTLIASSVGTVFGCGKNAQGQVGVGDINDRKAPVAVKPFGNEECKATSVVCRGNSSFVFTSAAEIYAFGDNAHGQLGVGDNRSVLTPRKVVVSPNWRVVSVASGTDHLVVLGDAVAPAPADAPHSQI